MDVKFSERSLQDFRAIADYLIVNAGGEVATNVVDEIERVIFELLADNPNLGTVALEPDQSVLFFPAGKYPAFQIYYRLGSDVIEVYRVLHGKRNVAKILG